MKPSNFAVVGIPAATVATSGTASLTFDRTGFDYATIIIQPGTFATDGETLRTITLRDADASTVHTSMTVVAGANFATTTTTNATSSMPAATELGLNAAIVMNVDLRKRAKYVSVGVTPGTTTSNISMVAVMLQPDQTKDTAAEKYLKNNYALATGATSVASVATF
jgi:hypothetical protein